MSDLKTNLEQIWIEKQYKVIPTNIKKDVQIFDVIGTYEGEPPDYSNTLTPEEYKECDSTLDEIINGGNEILLSEMNFFVQETEPEVKKGIWVKSNNNYANYITVQQIISDLGEYTKMTDIPYDFEYASTVAIGTDIYLVGGSKFISAGYSPMTKYDTVTGEYTSKTNMPFIFYSDPIALVGTDIYMFGTDYTGDILSKGVAKYSIVTDTYTIITNDILPYDFFECAVVGTDVYLFGGSRNVYGAVHKDIYKYDTNTGILTKMASLPREVRVIPVTVGTDIYLFQNESRIVYAYKYDTLTNTITSISVPTTTDYRSAENAAVVAVGSDIYFFGSSYMYYNRAFKYSTVTDEYISLADLPFTSYRRGSAVYIGTDIYLLGGSVQIPSGTSTEYHYDYNYKYTVSLETDIPNNSIVIDQGSNGPYSTELFDTPFIGGLLYKFNSIWLKDNDGVIDAATPAYYGDGTQWVQIRGGVSE